MATIVTTTSLLLKLTAIFQLSTFTAAAYFTTSNFDARQEAATHKSLFQATGRLSNSSLSTRSVFQCDESVQSFQQRQHPALSTFSPSSFTTSTGKGFSLAKSDSNRRILKRLQFTVATVLLIATLTLSPKHVLAAVDSTQHQAKPKFVACLSAVSAFFKSVIKAISHARNIIYVSIILLATWSTIDWMKVKERQRRDATSEWGRYARHPGARGRAVVSMIMIQLLPLYIASRVAGWLRPNSNLKDRFLQMSGNAFADGLLKLGPLYIKLGQIVSCRPKVLPKAWTVALERLQDRVPSRSGQRALDLAYQAWHGDKASFQQTFREFNTEPLAAASLGQVHKAILAESGDCVAIKLQRPYLREIYDQDLDLLMKIASFVDTFKKSQLGDVSWTKIFEDAEVILYREIDYRDEANNGLRICDDFGLGKGGVARQPRATSKDGKPLVSAASWLRVPHVYDKLSSEKFLVMEFVPSIKINSMDKLNAANVTEQDRIYLAEMLARSYLRQFCCNLFFSTDPHPGNLGVEILNPYATEPQDRVRLVLYDFGQASKLNEDQADGILAIIEAIVDMDVDSSIAAFKRMGVLQEGADMRKIRAKVADNFKTGKVKANRKRLDARGYKFKELKSKSSSLGDDNGLAADSEIFRYFKLPAEYAFVGRALGQMDGVGKTLDPEFDFISASAPWIYEIKGAGNYIREAAFKWIGSLGDKIKHIFPHYVHERSKIVS